MRRAVVALLFLLVLVVACSAEPETVEVTTIVEVPVEVTRIVEEIAEVDVTRLVEVEVTREVEVEVDVEVTTIVIQTVEKLVTPTHTPTNTPTPGPSPTPTPSLTPTPSPTPTSSPTPEPTRDIRADYNQIVYGELINYANNHKGELVKISGRVFNIGNGFFQIWLNGGSDSVIVAHSTCVGGLVCVSYLDDDHPLPEQIYDGTWITAYGEVWGYEHGTNAYGASISWPLVNADIIERG